MGHLDLGCASGRANTGDKLLTLDDADAAGGTRCSRLRVLDVRQRRWIVAGYDRITGSASYIVNAAGKRYDGASGQLTVRADSGFYAHALVAVCREMGVRFSITIRQHKGLRELIEAIPGRLDVHWRMWPRPPIPPSRVNPTPRRWAHRPAGEAHAR